ncbi:MAG: bacterioferritin [Myxococcales bacterium]|nr:bacterioferritin [Myxococcales bacterium]
MKSDPKIIEILNEVLTAELTAINQYFIHARMMKNWGFLKLAEHERKESIDEMKHAQQVMDRVLYLEGIPNVQRYSKINVGETVPEQLAADLQLEYDAVKRLNEGIKVVRDLGDHGTVELLEEILVSEEEHVDWIETQIGLIKQLGANAYLAEHLHE